MTNSLKIVTVKLPKSDLQRIPAGQTRSEFIRAAVSEKLAKLELKPWKPKTALGKKLIKLRQRYIASGGELLDAESIAEELRARRGGVG
ncbi:MAG TPA: ribbon-helix-helix domain-containing protein [Verrucomicrobiae bacterium]|jgi:hypothetical protein